MSTDLLTRDSLADRQGSARDYISPSRLNGSAVSEAVCSTLERTLALF
jgi:hypothetical protein